jgi:Zn-finger nucleic acid-binding protein
MVEVNKMFFKKKKKDFGEELLDCPRGHGKMEKIKKEGVVIDVCNKCGGMWLDNGEMEKLALMAKKIKGGKHEKKA